MFAKLFRRPAAVSEVREPSGPADSRAYAIGDVHGRLDLLNELRAAIADDIADRPVDRVFVIFIGDLIDRGPDSAGVVELACNGFLPGVQMVALMGNHEEMLMRIFTGEHRLMHDWLTYGGYACASSYGVDMALLRTLNTADAADMLRDAMPKRHVDFLDNLVDSFRFGDYLFVHAGVRPGVPLDRQRSADLRWIREGFLDWTGSHGVTVVHGHTIVQEPEEHGNRIAIDTGAYATGVLTALVLDGPERRYLQVTDHP